MDDSALATFVLSTASAGAARADELRVLGPGAPPSSVLFATVFLDVDLDAG